MAVEVLKIAVGDQSGSTEWGSASCSVTSHTGVIDARSFYVTLPLTDPLIRVKVWSLH